MSGSVSLMSEQVKDQRLVMRCSTGVAEAAYCMEQVMEYGADVMMLFFLLNVYDGQRYSEEQGGRFKQASTIQGNYTGHTSWL